MPRQVNSPQSRLHSIPLRNSRQPLILQTPRLRLKHRIIHLIQLLHQLIPHLRITILRRRSRKHSPSEAFTGFVVARIHLVRAFEVLELGAIVLKPADGLVGDEGPAAVGDVREEGGAEEAVDAV